MRAPAWEDSPGYVTLFAPPSRAVSYRAATTPLDLDAALQAIAPDPGASNSPGSFTPLPMAPLDAFGQSGAYDRWALARLFGATRPRVARGPRIQHGRVVEAWTLISPYPDPTFQHLEPGTLLLVLRLP